LEGETPASREHDTAVRGAVAGVKTFEKNEPLTNAAENRCSVTSACLRLPVRVCAQAAALACACAQAGGRQAQSGEAGGE